MQAIKQIFTKKKMSEKARLEAFLKAIPAAYYGWASDGSVAYSPDFASLLGRNEIKDLHDIQDALSPSDAAVLEGMCIRLQEEGTPFKIIVETGDRRRTLRVSGQRGTDTAEQAHFDILWLEDLSAQQDKLRHAEANAAEAADQRERLQLALDHLHAPVWLRDAHTDLQWINRAYSKALDATPAAIIQEQRDLALKPTDKKQAATKRFDRLMAEKALRENQTQEFTAHLIIGGKRHFMNVREIPLPGKHGTLGVAVDMTAMEELSSEKNRDSAANKELLEHLGTAIAIFDASEKLEFHNSAFSALWDLEDSYLHTHPKLGDVMEKLREMRRLPEQADFRKYKQSWINMFTGLLTPHEDMLYLPDGKALRMLVIPHPMGGLMMTFEDVTSRLELESSYNTLVAVQKETLDNLLEGVAAFGGDGRIKLWNPSFARLWHLNPEDLDSHPHISRITEKMKQLFPADEQEKQRELLMAQALDRNIREGRISCQDGTEIRYATMPLPDGGVLVTHVNITDTVRVENALREKNAALETAERLKLDFLANVSYQLRTPLNAIMGFSEILDHEYFGALNERQKEYTGGINEAGKRLLGLIDDILDLSTIEAGYMELHKEPVSVYKVLKAIYDLTQDWARKKKIEIALSCAKNIGSVPADERRLKQILLNIMSNAITFTPEGGTIHVSAKKQNGQMVIGITDSGDGIAAEDLERIFEPFEKTAHNKTRNGAGLGLALVKNIIELHQGSVMIDSEEGKGTTVSLYLPLEEQAEAAA